MSEGKPALRARLRAFRRKHVAALPAATRGLLFLRPPQPLAATIDPAAVIGVYAESPQEAPATRYAQWFFERGHTVALPWFADRESMMAFREWNPFADALETGPFNIAQPPAAAPEVEPNVVFVPLLGFTAEGARIGQGAGHYDRWLAARPAVRAIGLAWDCQLVAALPVEPHDRPLELVVTPTRMFGEPGS